MKKIIFSFVFSINLGIINLNIFMVIDLFIQMNFFVILFCIYCLTIEFNLLVKNM